VFDPTIGRKMLFKLSLRTGHTMTRAIKDNGTGTSSALIDR
jgi:hypothetical protein